MEENKKELEMVEVEEQSVNKVEEFFKGLGTILLYFALSFLGALLFGSLYKSENKVVSNLAEFGIYSIMFIGLAFVYRKRLKEDIKKFKKEYAKVALKNWLIGLGVMIACNIIVTMFTKDISVNESANRDALMASPITSILYMVIMGPLMEEITFRASFKKAFTKWYTFALVTGLFFGLAHIADWSNPLEFLFILPYGALGFFFAKAFYETDNIYTSYLAHMIHNAMCIVLIFIF